MKLRMPVGTRSLLFGAHQFILHPIYVALAWRKLYGSFPRALPIWVAFVVHDWGYWGKPEMDGPEGELHPMLGALILSRLFDGEGSQFWYNFAAGHSRYFARLARIPTSPLMRADKYATCLIPFRLYLLTCWLSGEWREYVGKHIAHGYTGAPTLPAWARHLRADWRARFGPLGSGRGR